VTYEGSKPNYQLDCSIRYIPERTLHKSKLFRRISPIQRMIRIYDQTKPDIAISFLPNANVYNVVASRVTKTRCIISERSDPYSEQGVLLNSKRFFYRFADGVVFQTEGAKNYYRGRISPLKSEIIPNPIMIDKVSRIAYEDRENIIAHVARLDVKQKRQDLMIMAFKRVAQVIPDVTLVFFGDGKDRGLLERMVSEHGLSERVKFAGKTLDVPEKIKNCRLFVSTSDYEGISNSVLEAMVLGLPVVATDASPGGTRMLIENGYNGVVVPVRDTKALSDSIVHLLRNPDIADTLGERAQEVATRYSPEAIIERWGVFIDRIVSSYR
ncbi:MAG: glycosyltransferase, partial [Caldicoprobacterales bacterium]